MQRANTQDITVINTVNGEWERILNDRNFRIIMVGPVLVRRSHHEGVQK